MKTWPRLLALFLVALCSFAPARAQSTRAQGKGQQKDQQGARRVYVGIYLNDVSNFDLKEGRFKADLYLWCKWSGEKKTPPLVLANAEIEEQKEEARESDGDWHSARWRVRGTFRGTFPLHKFPFDRQQLKIEVETPGSEYSIAPDLAGSGMAGQFSITGWLYEPFFKAALSSRNYASDLGAIAREGKPHRVGTVAFVLDIKRPVASYAIKFLVPLGIIIVMALLALYVPPHELEVRTAMGVTALLSCVAFHFSQADSLPDMPYLVTADKFFLYSYAVILLTLVLIVIAYYRQETERERVMKWDRISAVAIGAALLAALAVTLRIALAPPAEVRAATREELKPAPSSKREITLSVVNLESLNAFDIQNGLLRRGLFTVGPDGEKTPHLLRVVPDMTNEYVRFLTDGGMTVRWALRPGLRWSDGWAITARDVAFSARASGNDDIRKVTVLDSLTVEVEYSHRASGNLEAFDIYPQKHMEATFQSGGIEALEEKIKTSPPPGDGPFVVEKFTPDKIAVFRRNPRFSGKPPALETIRLLAGSTKTPLEEMKSGEVDLHPSISILTSRKLKTLNDVAVRYDLTDEIFVLQPDLSTPPLNNVLVRRAILHALDRKRIARDLSGEYGQVAHTYRLQNSDDYARDVLHYEYSPARAKQLLKQARVKLPLRIPLIALQVPEGNVRQRALKTIQSNLASAGIIAQPRFVSGGISRLYFGGRHGGLLFLSRDVEKQHARFWNVPYENGEYAAEKPNRLFTHEVVELFEQHQTTLFEERRRLLSQRLQKVWSQRLPVLPLIFTGQGSARRDNLIGWKPRPGLNIWWNVEEWRFDAPRADEN